MSANISMTERTDLPGSYTVHASKRLIGFVKFITINRIGHWRFIPNRKDISEKYGVPSPKFDSVADVLTDIKSKLEA